MRRFNRFMAVAAALVLAGSIGACGDDDENGNGGDGGTGGVGGTGGTGGVGGTGGGNGGTGGTGGNGGGGDFPECEGRGGEVIVDADITTDTTWCASEEIFLEDYVFVTNGATLRIQPGTVIKGTLDTALTITRGAKIDANGTADAPIVFTSAEPEGDRQPMDWGGLVILGRAPINVDGDESTVDENNVEGFADTLGEKIRYGGNDPADDSGVLRYVRIEWAGEVVGEDDELNGLTLGGVGNGTTLEYIQVHGGSDDGIEFFGGTVNAKYLVVSDVEDDSIDWDFGYTGKIQYVVIRQGPAGDHGYEGASNKAFPNSTPRATPEIWNVTMIGGGETATKTQRAATFKEGSAGKLGNHLVTNFKDFTFDVSGEESAAQWGTNLTVVSSLFFENGNNEAADNTDGDFDELAAFRGVESNDFSTDPQLGDFSGTNPSFVPASRLDGQAPPADGFFDVDATFIGAIGDQDWTADWTAFDAG